jgi:hypothetical protein
MDDNNLIFSFEDEEPEDEDLEAEEGQNRAFLIGALALAGVLMVGICLVVYLVVIRPRQQGQGQVSEVELTNQANQATATEVTSLKLTANYETQTAPTATPEEIEETEEPVVEASPTPTSGVTVTVMEEEAPTEEEGTPGVEEEEGTPGAEEEEGTPGAEEEEGTPGAEEEEGTPGVEEEEETPGAEEEEGTPAAEGEEGEATPTSLVPADTLAPTSIIIEVTPLGGGRATPTPIAVAEGEEGAGGGGEATATPITPAIGGPIEPTASPTLPTTGLLGSGPGLAGVGLLALALVGVAVIVRRLRLK